MRRIFRVVLLSLLPVVCPVVAAIGQQLPVPKPEDVGVSSEKLATITDFNRKLIADQKIAGAVTAVAGRGKVVFLETAGMMDREAGKPMRPDTIFRIASMTKPITTVAAMILYDEGKIALEDSVSKYIPEFANPRVLVKAGATETVSAETEITLRHLLTHTSGLNEGKLKRLGSERLKYLDAFEYSVDYPVRGPRRYFCGGGGLSSTVPEYLRLCQMLLNGGELDGVRLLRPQTVTIMTTNQIGDLRVTFGGQKLGVGFILPEKGSYQTPKVWKAATRSAASSPPVSGSCRNVNSSSCT